ncbi:cytidine/deoxycytidylate deaminase [Hyaloraphidium curvatum]|nr:cytidine/deoxycytidylate deaminase [Hyaloraphidium curvatum]
MDPSSDASRMRTALSEARAALLAGDPPYGAALFSPAGAELARARERVFSMDDATRHAELDAVRGAAGSAKGATLYATGEPCAMCFAAAWWAGVDRVVYGCAAADVAAIVPEERMLRLSAAEVNAAADPPVLLEGGVLAQECLALFREFAATEAGTA